MSGLSVPKHTRPRGYNQPRQPKCDLCQDEVWLVEFETAAGIFEAARPCPECGKTEEDFYAAR